MLRITIAAALLMPAVASAQIVFQRVYVSPQQQFQHQAHVLVLQPIQYGVQHYGPQVQAAQQVGSMLQRTWVYRTPPMIMIQQPSAPLYWVPPSGQRRIY